MERVFVLPVGTLRDNVLIKEVPIARTGAEAEEVYLGKPAQTKIYTWFGEVLAVSIESIGSANVNADFLKSFNKDRAIPKAVRDLSLNDVGSLILQVQRECWQDVIKDQRLNCRECGKAFQADIDLKKIDVTADEQKYEFVDIRLARTYTVNTGIELLEEYDGREYNMIRFRIPTLDDAIRHEKLNVDDTTFWRSILFDTMDSFHLCEFDSSGEAITKEETVDNRYCGLRGKLVFSKDLDARDLRNLRSGITAQLPSALFYYEDTCACGKEQTPFFTEMSSFFTI
jgi:hypothetical protein